MWHEDKVTLRLTRHGSHFAIERNTVHAGRVFLRVCVPLPDHDTLYRFASSDPLRDSELKRAYESMLHEYERAVHESVRLHTPPAEDPATGNGAREVEAIDNCGCAGELDAILRPFIKARGANQYLFLVLQADGGRPVQYRYLCGCDPVWAQLYLHHRRWFSIDRSIALAQRDAAPIRGSKVLNAGLKEVEMAQIAREHGFCSWIAVSSRHRSNDWVGILYAANERHPENDGEELILRSKWELEGLARELLEWQLQLQRQEFAAKYDLSGKELRVLQLTRDGFTGCEIGKQLGLSVRTIYDLNTSICQKMAVAGIKEAAKQAFLEGLAS